MRELLLRLRVPLLFMGLVLFALLTMLSDQRARRAGGRDLPLWTGALLEAAAPIQKLLTAPVVYVRDLSQRYFALVGVREENARLAERVARLEEENLQFREALLASGRLERIAEMRHDFEIPMLPGQVVGQDLSPWFHSVVLDRGRAQGARSGMPVVTESGIVGLVTATTPNASKVMLLVDRQSAIDGIVERSRARGIVRGDGDALELEFAVRGDDVQVGDLVISSGLGGVYPKGLRIGVVTDVAEPGKSLLQRARVEPAVELGRLEQVFVLLWRSPTLELLSEDPAPAAGGAPAARPEPSS